MALGLYQPEVRCGRNKMKSVECGCIYTTAIRCFKSNFNATWDGSRSRANGGEVDVLLHEDRVTRPRKLVKMD